MKFAEHTLKDFTAEVASQQPTPGGGSVAGLCGALSASLLSMVVALTKNQSLNEYADELEAIRKEALELMDKDAASFDEVMAAFRMPKETEEEKEKRRAGIQSALKQASIVPLDTMKLGLKLLEIARHVVEKGNPNAVSDVGVAGLAAMTAIKGGGYNVLINAYSLDNREILQKLVDEVEEIVEEGEKLLAEIEKITTHKITGSK
jgi:formiminotetrahydrofolate cyclodeaminase